MSALLLFAVLGGMPENSDYVPLARLEELRCVKAWEQLCAVSDADFPSVMVTAGTVTVRPFMDDSELVFKVAAIRSDRWLLKATHDGAPLQATLTFEPSGRATYQGPDVAALLRAEKPAAITLRLVKSELVEKTIRPLREKLGPTGKCQGLTAWRDDGKPARCLNTADGKPAAEM
jgi:hypothetical protein